MGLAERTRKSSIPSLYYAVNEVPYYQQLAEYSIETLRKHNRDIPVSFFSYSGRAPKNQTCIRRLGAQVQVRPQVRELPPTYLKWRALAECQSPRNLFLDADTVFNGDPAILFRRWQRAHFYARNELVADPQLKVRLIGNAIIPPMVNYPVLKKVSRQMKLKPTPIFNSGVMLFNHGIHKRIGMRWAEFARLHRFFLLRPEFSPVNKTNPHLIEEIVASMVLGSVPNLKFSPMDSISVPYFVEWKGGVVPSPGIVMHLGQLCAPFYVLEKSGPRAVKRLRLPFGIETPR